MAGDRYDDDRHVTTAQFRAHHGEYVGHELVHGRVIAIPPADANHAALAARLSRFLDGYVAGRGRGVALTGDVGYELAPNLLRTADIGVHLEQPKDSSLWLAEPPDLLVEILSPSKDRSGVDDKVRQFFQAGTQEAWIADGHDDQGVHVVSPDGGHQSFHPPTALVSRVLPGFMLWLEQVFD